MNNQDWEKPRSNSIMATIRYSIMKKVRLNTDLQDRSHMEKRTGNSLLAQIWLKQNEENRGRRIKKIRQGD